MSRNRLCMIFGLILVNSVHQACCCGYAEIGKQFTITSPETYVSFYAKVEWKSGDSVTLYNSELFNPNIYPDRYAGTRTELTILNVTIHDKKAVIKHFVNGVDVFTCNLKVYIANKVSKVAHERQSEINSSEEDESNESDDESDVNEKEAEVWEDAQDGPSSASLTFQHPGPIYLCPNQQTLVGITCQVPEDSFNFNPSILFTIREGNNNSLVTKAAGVPPWSKSVQYTVTRTGQHTFTCRAENAISSDIFIEAPASSIQVYAPPQSPPSIQVTGESVVTDDSGAWVVKWSEISVSCSVPEGNTSVKSVFVRCGHKSSASGQLSFPSLNKYEMDCQCSVDYETETPCDGFNLNSTMSIKTIDGPGFLTVSFADDQLNEVPNKPLNLCSFEGLNVTVICAVNGVRPELTINDFTLTKHDAVVAQKVYLTNTRWRDYTLVNQLKIKTEGNHTLICEVRNPIFPDIKKSESITIEVRKPPSEGPVLTARSIQHGNILVQGDDVTVICAVFGGIPSVYTLSLICGRKRVIRNESSVRLSLNKIGLSHKETYCTCQATHVTGCYDKMGFLSWTVFSVHPHKARQNVYTTAELAAGVIGSSVGTMMIVTAIAKIVLFIRTGNGKCKNRNEETVSECVSQENGLISRDQSYGDYINPVQPNHNSTLYNNYIEILEDDTYTKV